MAGANRQLIRFSIDLLLWVGATPLAYLIRLEGAVGSHMDDVLVLCLVGLLAKGGILYALGLYRRTWRTVSVGDLWLLIRGMVLVTLFYTALAFFLSGLFIPRSVPLIEGMLALLALSSARLLARAYYEQRWRFSRDDGTARKHVLIIGAGDAGSAIAREMFRNVEAGIVPIGFLDDDPTKQQQLISGLPVFGGIDNLAEVVQRHPVDEVLIAMPSRGGEVVRRVIQATRKLGVKHRIIPSLPALISGEVSIAEIREVDVQDLLQRDGIELEVAAIRRYIEGRDVLVTGAGGSIGSEIVRQVARFGPRRVLLLGRGEGSIYKIEQECRLRWPDRGWTPIIADVRDREKLEHVFRQHHPQVIFHAAAHKHVPLMEAHPDEAIFNNVLGTKNIVELALAFDVERLVNISTDKAVRPSSVMGASKRVAEYLVEWGSRQTKPGARFASVRFGNVLGSRGSVIPLFRKQIEEGGPVTVTHPDVERFFMTIPEAVQLVLQAGALGENGNVYILDMGRPIKIVDLARDLIQLYGLEPDVDINITYTGLRPGEKLFEEFLTAEEGTTVSRHKKIYIAHKRGLPGDRLANLLPELLVAARSREAAFIREVLRELIPSHMLGPREVIGPEEEIGTREAS